MKACIALLSVLLLCATTVADEINLKDGSKIVGTVIGFEDHSYQVQTSFGILTFPKNMIASIIPSTTKSPDTMPPATTTTFPSITAPSGTARASSAITSLAKPEPKAAAKKDAPAKNQTPMEVKAREQTKISSEPARTVSNSTAMATKQSAPVSANIASGGGEKPDAAATKEPEVPAIREEVHGNQYINRTYGFRMYKAPSWNLIDDDTRKTLPNAIVALGASDDSTLLVVGIERSKESLESRAAATEKRLREIYENYRRISEQKTTVAGLPAIERRYRGIADGHDWSGVVVTLGRGGAVYTLLGMTYAESDLIQIQENVIARAIASLDFSQR